MSGTPLRQPGAFDVALNVQLLPAGSGRAKPTPGKEWLCRLKINDRFYEAKLIGDAPYFIPGEQTSAKVIFLHMPKETGLFKKGLNVEVWELKKVATASFI